MPIHSLHRPTGGRMELRVTRTSLVTNRPNPNLVYQRAAGIISVAVRATVAEVVATKIAARVSATVVLIGRWSLQCCFL